jgi:hypothetical protein
MTTMTTTFSSLDGIGSKQRNRSVWRQFLHSMIEAPTPRAEDEIARYLACHRHDLPPQVWIELERRRFGP